MDSLSATSTSDALSDDLSLPPNEKPEAEKSDNDQESKKTLVARYFESGAHDIMIIGSGRVVDIRVSFAEGCFGGRKYHDFGVGKAFRAVISQSITVSTLRYMLWLLLLSIKENRDDHHFSPHEYLLEIELLVGPADESDSKIRLKGDWTLSVLSSYGRLQPAKCLVILQKCDDPMARSWRKGVGCDSVIMGWDRLPGNMQPTTWVVDNSEWTF